jgi:hypothetical protein
MKVIQSLSAHVAAGVLVLVAGTSTAAPKNYVFTGKFTSNRGVLINLPVVGDTPCAGVGLSNLRIMSGPGLTGPHTLGSMTLMTMQPNPTPAVHPFDQFANGHKADYYCVGFAPGKKLTSTGIGVGGQFTVPTKALLHPFPGMTTAIHVPNATPIIQLASSALITGPRKVGTLLNSTSPSKSATVGMAWKNNWRKFQKNAHLAQPGRVQGAMFSYCWGVPGCTNVTQGANPLIVKYAGGGNQFGGTMSWLFTTGTNLSNLAIGAGGGAVGFAIISGMGSQVTGRGYGARLTDALAPGPLWGAYMTGPVTRPIVGQQKLITMVYAYLGPGFPAAKNYNRGFPFTTMTVLARNTGTAAGNKVATTLTAMGGDTVTAMGKRNISLVAGGMARGIIGPAVSNTPAIAQLYIPEPSRAVQMFAGVAALLAIAVWRSVRNH